MSEVMNKQLASVVIPFIESRFLQVAELEGDIALFPLTKENHLQVVTDKDKSNKFGEVFTPLWLVDEMITRVSDYDWKNPYTTTLDLCAGYGQFTIRMLRKKYSVLGDNFDVYKFLKSYPDEIRKQSATHSFSELQLTSAYKLLFIFGSRINLFIGDSRMLNILPDGTKGIWYYCTKSNNWIECTDKVAEWIGSPSRYNIKRETKFVDLFTQEFITDDNPETEA
jgi:hypothetical protein